MNLRTHYMGIALANPFIVSSSKLTSTIQGLRRCEEAGAGAVVLKSLFEEQILAEIDARLMDDSMYFWFPEAKNHVAEISKEQGVKEYLRLASEAVSSLTIPVIASINCLTANEWPSFAKQIQESGVAGIELNISVFPFDPAVSSEQVEDLYVEILKQVKSQVSIPVAVKIGYNFSNLSRMAIRLSDAGADALVLFNRFFRPDIDIEKIALINTNTLSAPEEMTESLRWIGILSSQLKADLAASTGIHNAEMAIKQILAGASAVQVCSVLYKHGIDYLQVMTRGTEDWMARHRFAGIDAFQGLLSQDKLHAAAYERVQFMKKTTDDL
jgi:dihydroorotate dehydrogenase (fumarate)